MEMVLIWIRNNIALSVHFCESEVVKVEGISKLNNLSNHGVFFHNSCYSVILSEYIFLLILEKKIKININVYENS